MRISVWPRRATLALAAVATLTLTACASLGGGAEQRVQNNAQARWDALLGGDFDKAYAFSTEGFKKVVTQRQYPLRFSNAVKWLGASVTQVRCPQADKCTVQVRLRFQPVLHRSTEPSVTFIDETWLLENGQWRVVQDL